MYTFDEKPRETIDAARVKWMLLHDIWPVERIDWPSGIYYVKVRTPKGEVAANGFSARDALDKIFDDLGCGGVLYGIWHLEHELWLLKQDLQSLRKQLPPWISS